MSTGADDELTTRQRWLVAAAVFAVAIAARLLVSTKVGLSADEAVQGIAALNLLQHGEIGLFYPGQAYGGVLGILVQAPLQALASGNVFLLRLPFVLFSSASCAIFALLLFPMLRSRPMAIFGGLLAAVAPTTFVVIGATHPGGSQSGTFCAMAGLLLTLPFIDRPSVRSGIAPAVLFVLAAYSQPITLLLVLPMLVILLTVRRPSFWRAEGTGVLHRKFSGLLSPGLVLLLVPMGATIVAQLVWADAQTASGVNVKPGALEFDQFESVRVGFGLQTLPYWPLNQDPFNINAPATWQAFDLNHVSQGFAIGASIVLWCLVVLGAVVFVGSLFKREPGFKVAKLGAAALGLTALGAMLAGYAWQAPSYGRYVFAGTFVALAVVAILVSCLPKRGQVSVAVVFLVAAVALLVSDTAAARSPIAEAISPAGMVVIPADQPLVGDYWEVYTEQFLTANRVQALPLGANRFPAQAAEQLPIGGTTTVTLLLPVEGSPVREAAEKLRAACKEISSRAVAGREFIELDCPNAALRTDLPPAYK